MSTVWRIFEIEREGDAIVLRPEGRPDGEEFPLSVVVDEVEHNRGVVDEGDRRRATCDATRPAKGGGRVLEVRIFLDGSAEIAKVGGRGGAAHRGDALAREVLWSVDVGAKRGERERTRDERSHGRKHHDAQERPDVVEHPAEMSSRHPDGRPDHLFARPEERIENPRPVGPGDGPGRVRVGAVNPPGDVRGDQEREEKHADRFQQAQGKHQAQRVERAVVASRNHDLQARPVHGLRELQRLLAVGRDGDGGDAYRILAELHRRKQLGQCVIDLEAALEPAFGRNRAPQVRAEPGQAAPFVRHDEGRQDARGDDDLLSRQAGVLLRPRGTCSPQLNRERECRADHPGGVPAHSADLGPSGNLRADHVTPVGFLDCARDPIAIDPSPVKTKPTSMLTAVRFADPQAQDGRAAGLRSAGPAGRRALPRASRVIT